ncbi:hypothetical protein LSTR_LSTR013677, partial [Laodelphax striatellus]
MKTFWFDLFVLITFFPVFSGDAAAGAPARQNSAGASGRDISQRILQLSQKGDWPPMDQVIKSLEKLVAAGGEDVNPQPLLGLADHATGMTPLMYAVKENRTSFVDRLIELGCDVTARNNVDTHPNYRRKLSRESTQSVESICALKAPPPFTRQGPLARGDLETMLKLNENDIEQSAGRQDNYNALHVASMFSREEIVKLLLAKKGVDIYAPGGKERMDDDEDDDSVFDDDDYEEEKNEEEEEEEAKEETQRISDDMKRIESMMEQLKKAREQVMERLKDTFSKDEVLSEIMKFSAAEQRKVKPTSITEAINQEEEPLKPIAVEVI